MRVRNDLPPGWEYATVGEICEPSQYGYTAKASPSGEVHYLRTTDITSGSIEWASVPYCTISNDEESKYQLQDGDVVISRAGSVGFSYLISMPPRSVFASYLIRFWPLIKRKYFSLFLKTPDYWDAISERSLGIAVQNVNASKISEIQIPIAPLNEQTRIIEKLEELLSDLDAGMSELRSAQKKLAQYRQSILKAAVEGSLTAEWRAHNVPRENGTQLLERILIERRKRWESKQLAKFKEQGKTPPSGWKSKYREPVKPDTTNLPKLPEGWIWSSIEQVVSDEPYSLAIGPFGSNLKVSDYRDAGVPLVFVRNIRSRQYGGTYTNFINPEKAEELSAHKVKAGDVLITKMGEPPGDADVYPNDQPSAIITADCIKVRCWPKLMIAELLAAAINSHFGRIQIEPITQGVAQKKVSLGRFSSVAVPLMSIEEQILIADLLKTAWDGADKQAQAIQRGIKQSIAQRKNILKAAFSGQLVPQDPNDEPAAVLLERIQKERAEREKQPKLRTLKVKKEITPMVRKLIDVLAEANDWLPAQEVFRRCEVADNAQTDQIEALYAELRELDKAQKLAVEPVTDAQGRKLHDRLKLLAKA